MLERKDAIPKKVLESITFVLIYPTVHAMWTSYRIPEC